jgi:hypothetical protein
LQVLFQGIRDFHAKLLSLQKTYNDAATKRGRVESEGLGLQGQKKKKRGKIKEMGFMEKNASNALEKNQHQLFEMEQLYFQQ